MKKFLLGMLISALAVTGFSKVHAVTYKEAISQSKPIAIVVYADWADGAQDVLKSFGAMELSHSEQYNFVKLNIASEETKLFNKTYHIYPDLPYVLLFKEKGKISRYLKKDCVTNDSCFEERLKFFLN